MFTLNMSSRILFSLAPHQRQAQLVFFNSAPLARLVECAVRAGLALPGRQRDRIARLGKGDLDFHDFTLVSPFDADDSAQGMRHFDQVGMIAPRAGITLPTVAPVP